jgi:hypothetical protein
MKLGCKVSAAKRCIESSFPAAVSWIEVVMSKPARSAKSTAHPATSPKKPLKDLFDERDATRPGSKEEEQAAEKILESLFPDTNAG